MGASQAGESEREMAKPLENQGQAFAQDEPSGVVSGAYIHSASWTCRLFFHSSEAGGGIAPYVSVCGSHASGGAFAFAPGTGLFLQRRRGDRPDHKQH